MPNKTIKINIVKYATVLFNDQHIPCAIGSDLQVYIPLSGPCDVMGIDPDAQAERIREHRALQGGLVKINYPVPYGKKGQTRMTEVNAISLMRLHAWLITIPSDRLNNPEAAEALALMQEELADTLYMVFGRPAIPGDLRIEQEQNLPTETLEAYARADELREALNRVGQLKGEVDEMGERIKALEVWVSDKRDFITEQQKALYRKWVAVIGELLVKKGKGDYAYVERELKEQFHFASYKLIDQELFPKIRAFCIQWYKKITPPGTPLPSAFTDPEQRSLF